MYALLFLFWLVLNGRITLEIVLTGLVLTAALALLLRIFAGYTLRKEWRFLRKAPLFLAYLAVLIFEILKASFSMFHFILSAGKNIEPALVTFRPGLKTGFGRFILANSITLTPGTITVGVKDGVFTVHCLKRSMLNTSDNSVFIRWIRRLEA